MKTKKQLREESRNAEQRALTHFRKLQLIEDIIAKAEIQKTPSVFIVDQIKNVICSKEIEAV